MISVATPIVENHHIVRNELVRMHTAYKNTRGKVQSIYPSLVWHDTEKKKKTRQYKEKFKRKSFLSALPGIKAQKCTTTIDPAMLIPTPETIHNRVQVKRISSFRNGNDGVGSRSWKAKLQTKEVEKQIN